MIKFLIIRPFIIDFIVFQLKFEKFHDGIEKQIQSV